MSNSIYNIFKEPEVYDKNVTLKGTQRYTYFSKTNFK